MRANYYTLNHFKFTNCSIKFELIFPSAVLKRSVYEYRLLLAYQSFFILQHAKFSNVQDDKFLFKRKHNAVQDSPSLSSSLVHSWPLFENASNEIANHGHIWTVFHLVKVSITFSLPLLHRIRSHDMTYLFAICQQNLLPCWKMSSFNL